MQAEVGTFRCCDWSDDAKLFVTADDEGHVTAWDTRTGKMERRVGKHDGPATSVCVSKNGTTVISGGWDNVVQVNDLRKPVAAFYRGHTDWVLSTVGVPTTNQVVSSGWDSTVRLWHSANNSDVLAGHVDTVTSVDVSPNGLFIASGSYDKTVKIWSLASRSVTKTLSHSSKVNKVVFTPKSDLLLAASSDHIVNLWNVHTGHSQNSFVCQGPATALDAVSRNGELLMVFGDFIGKLYLTKLNTFSQ